MTVTQHDGIFYLSRFQSNLLLFFIFLSTGPQDVEKAPSHSGKYLLSPSVKTLNLNTKMFANGDRCRWPPVITSHETN